MQTVNKKKIKQYYFLLKLNSRQHSSEYKIRVILTQNSNKSQGGKYSKP